MIDPYCQYVSAVLVVVVEEKEVHAGERLQALLCRDVVLEAPGL
jgi:hypothetical protein